MKDTCRSLQTPTYISTKKTTCVVQTCPKSHDLMYQPSHGTPHAYCLLTGLGEFAIRRARACSSAAFRAADCWDARRVCTKWADAARQVARFEVAVNVNKGSPLRKAQAFQRIMHKTPRARVVFHLVKPLRLDEGARVLQQLTLQVDKLFNKCLANP